MCSKTLCCDCGKLIEFIYCADRRNKKCSGRDISTKKIRCRDCVAKKRNEK